MSLLDGILPPAECSDMLLTTRLRAILRNNERGIAERVMREYKFWYHDMMDTTSQVYWSENHYIMNCSCELLLREYLGYDIPEALLQRIRMFLTLKMDLGMAEFLSPVYLPFTIASLLNLYDYTTIQVIRDQCAYIMQRLGKGVLTVASMDGGIVSPSGRAYARHREKTTGLHLNLFIEFLRRGKPLPYNPLDAEMALREVLSSTSYRPPASVFTYHSIEPLDVDMTLSPSYDELLEFLHQDDEVTDDIFVSVLWSHGIYFPRDLESVRRVVTFMDAHGLWSHPHFKVLKRIRSIFSCSKGQKCIVRALHALSNAYVVNDYVRGAYLTDATLRVHREGNVVLSSLVNYNHGLPSFQQWPFAINLDGIPIWSGYGAVNQGVIPCLGNPEAGKEMSTARVIPILSHIHNHLRVTYRSSNGMLRMCNTRLRPYVRWPTHEFDESGAFMDSSRRHWEWARKGSACVAYYQHGNTIDFVIRDLTAFNTTILQFLETVTMSDA